MSFWLAKEVSKKIISEWEKRLDSPSDFYTVFKSNEEFFVYGDSALRLHVKVHIQEDNMGTMGDLTFISIKNIKNDRIHTHCGFLKDVITLDKEIKDVLKFILNEKEKYYG